MNFYHPLLFLTVVFVLMGLWQSDLIGYPIAAAFAFSLMLLLRHYAAIWVLGLAVGTQNELLRYFLVRSSTTIATVSPLLLVGAAYAFNLNRFVFYLSIAVACCSAGLTGGYEFQRLAVYHTRYALFYLLGEIDLFAVVGVVGTSAVCIKALRLHGGKFQQRKVQRAPSALHGESDWRPIRRAQQWFGVGGIVVGEAYRPDLLPRLGGKASLLRYDGATGSGHVLVFAGSGGYKTTATVIPSALEWSAGLVCLDPALEVFPRVYAAWRNLGHRVASLNPEDPASAGFNVLDWIDTSSDRALLDIQSVVAWLCGETPGERYEDYFRHAARALLSCLLADILFSPTIGPEYKTLGLLRRRVALPMPELRHSRARRCARHGCSAPQRATLNLAPPSRLG